MASNPPPETPSPTPPATPSAPPPEIVPPTPDIDVPAPPAPASDPPASQSFKRRMAAAPYPSVALSIIDWASASRAS